MVPHPGSLATVPSVDYFHQVEHDPSNFEMVTAGQGLKGAVHNGMFGSSSSQVSMIRQAMAGTGWPAWDLPNWVSAGNESSLTQRTGTGNPDNHQTKDYGNWSINYPHMQNMSIVTAQSFFWAPQTSNISESTPHAAKCILYFCVHTYNATVIDGQFEEILAATWPDPKKSLPDSLTNQWSVQLLKQYSGNLPEGTDPNMDGLLSNVSSANITFTVPGEGAIDHVLDWLTLIGLRSWIGQEWYMDMNEQDTTRDMLQVAYNSYTGDSGSTKQPSGRDEAVAAVSKMPGPERMWADAANSMTTYLRSQDAGQRSAQGVAFSATTYVSVRWEWAILPILLLILTLAFLVLTVAISVEKEIPL
ncbi:hypothetical protein Slin15195_G115720 [Septoria linicola]|uniref:Uncharacterized protein n=1 Tax=Septoria linicola TaxID=215465 RepID=A0A9Q9B3G8_9PEZI|nr:hypothetical protein Slin15195_G115720 [Septoria linicola]